VNAGYQDFSFKTDTGRSLKALGLAAVIAPAVLFGAYALISYDQAFRNAETRAAHLSSILQEHAQRVFETIALALRNTDQRLGDSDWKTVGASRSLWEEIGRIQAAGPQLGSIFAIGPDGTNVLTTREFPAPPFDFSDRDYFEAQRQSNAGLFLGRAYIGKISDVPIFNFSIRRSGRDGSFNGIIGSSAYVQYFQEFYATVGDPGDEFSVVLVREDGEILSRFPRFTVGAKFADNLLHPKNEHARRVVYAVSPIDGKARLYASAKVGQFPAYIAYSIERGSIVRGWMNGLLIPGAAALGAALLLSLLTSYALRRAGRERAAVEQLRQTASSLDHEVQRRRRAEASLLQTQKLEAVGRLTGGIAHDFNNLLMVISGNLALAQKRTDLTKIQRLLKSAQYAAERGAGLSRQLLAFSRGQSLRPAIVDLNQLLGNARTWIGRAITEGIDIRFDCEPALWPVRVDVAQFEAALLNLVVNARDGMDGRGSLVLATRNVTLSESDSRLPMLPTGDYVAFSVADTGTGIPPDVLARIYEPFFTTKEVGKGSGLGLSQVHGFIRQSGGDISIASEVGKGTTVALYLPRSHAAPTAVSASEIATVEGSVLPGEDVVLVVEDDGEVRKVTTAMLQELGYQPVVARSSREALAIIVAGEPVDVLFTDMILPRGMDGAELASKALEIRPSLRVLLTTASLDFKSRFPVLQKPFTKEQLASGLQQLERALVPGGANE
jgi:two-component system NtrC family sensor kinase